MWEGGGGKGREGGVTVLNGHIMLSLDRPKEAMSQIIHGAGVVYIKEKGEGIGGGLSTATEDSLWKMPQLPSQDGDVIRVEHAFPHAVSCAACVCVRESPLARACSCVCFWREENEHTRAHTQTSYMLHHLQAVLSCTTGMLPLE